MIHTDYVSFRKLGYDEHDQLKGGLLRRPAVEALSGDLGIDSEEVSAMLAIARDVRRENGNNYAAVFAIAADRELTLYYGGRLYRWRILASNSDASEHYRQHAPEYARYLEAGDRADDALELLEQARKAWQRAEAAKQAAFGAWQRAGSPRAKFTEPKNGTPEWDALYEEYLRTHGAGSWEQFLEDKKAGRR
jgi:hypothetical protein